MAEVPIKVEHVSGCGNKSYLCGTMLVHKDFKIKNPEQVIKNMVQMKFCGTTYDSQGQMVITDEELKRMKEDFLKVDRT